jgi:hypothetical protein
LISNKRNELEINFGRKRIKKLLLRPTKEEDSLIRELNQTIIRKDRSPNDSQELISKMIRRSFQRGARMNNSLAGNNSK